MKKIGRNDPCPCGSRKKYKQCCEARDNVRHQSVAPNTAISKLLQQALEYHQSGELVNAEVIYRQILQLDPNHADALHLLGVIAIQVGKSEIAIELISKAIVLKPDFAEAYNNLGNAFSDSKRYDDAIIAYRQALKLKPDFAEAYNNLGTAQKEINELNAAIVCYRAAINLKREYAEAHNNLGIALQQQKQYEEAIVAYRNAVKYKPNYVEAYTCLGNALAIQGQEIEALKCHQSVIAIKPDHIESLNNIGNILVHQNKLEDAIHFYRQALQHQPNSPEVLINLGNTFRAQDKLIDALSCFVKSLQIKETTEAKRDFSACIKNISFNENDSLVQDFLIRAVSEPWGHPSDLASACISFIKLNPNIRQSIETILSVWPVRLSSQALHHTIEFSSITEDLLLIVLMKTVPVCDVGLERLLTTIRAMLLDAAIANVDAEPNEKSLNFYCALAQQCFINEYIFIYTEEEFIKAQTLRDLLNKLISSESPCSPSLLMVIAVSAYFPLAELSVVEKLLQFPFPDVVKKLLVQQINEPKEELQYQSKICSLTDIEDGVSRLVRQQYEENPYPRWIKSPPCGNQLSFDMYLRQQFPKAPIQPVSSTNEMNILIAGCGTGLQSIQTAMQFPNASVLAIDLSLTSLGYAKRKTCELNLSNIEYAHADIMILGSLQRRFDFIESVGVVHHLANPVEGLRQLLSLLRPQGIMHLGVYSEFARKSVVAGRRFIAEQGYAGSPEDIRRCRQNLLSGQGQEELTGLLAFSDFFSMSECRDLLFHVQEHRFTLLQLKEIFAKFDLQFLGFALDRAVLNNYKQQFPQDEANNNLDNWHAYEITNPNTFARMYRFFVQAK